MSFLLKAAQYLQMQAVRVFPFFTPQSTQLKYLVCQNVKHYFRVDALQDSGIVILYTESISRMEYSSLDDTLPLFQELPFE